MDSCSISHALSSPPGGGYSGVVEASKHTSGHDGIGMSGRCITETAVTPPSGSDPLSSAPYPGGGGGGVWCCSCTEDSSCSPSFSPRPSPPPSCSPSAPSAIASSSSSSSPSAASLNCHHHHRHHHHHHSHSRTLSHSHHSPPLPPLSTADFPSSPSSSPCPAFQQQHHHCLLSASSTSPSTSTHPGSGSSSIHSRYAACHSHSQSLPAQISAFSSSSSPSRSTALRPRPRPLPLRHTFSSPSRTRSLTSNTNTTSIGASNTTSSSSFSSTASSPTSSSSLASTPSSADQSEFQASLSTPNSPSNASYYSTLARHQIRQLSNPNPISYPPTTTNTGTSAQTPLLPPGSKATDNIQQQSSSNIISSSFTTLARAKTILIGRPLLSSLQPPPCILPANNNKYDAQEHPYNRYTQPGHKFKSSSIPALAPAVNPNLQDHRFEREDCSNNNNCSAFPKLYQGSTSFDNLEGGNEVSIIAIDTPKSNMHQSSSRLLRMTQDDRPFTKDFKDLFSTLIVSLPLTSHRLRFKTYNFSFTSDEAVNNLGSLKFSQSNRMPDPKDPSRIVTTTTTTTFSMAKEMARTVCQKFVAARFMEAVAEKTGTPFTAKNILWQLTPKGIHVLEQFCQRNGINSPHILNLLASPYNTMKLVILERDVVTDKLSHDKTTVEIIFRRFAGATPNVKSSTSLSDSDSISEYSDGNTGIRIAESRKVFDKIARYSFTGKAAVDWLLDCCTTIEPLETIEIAELFFKYGLIQAVVEDKMYVQQNPSARIFQPTKISIYVFTEKGKRVAGWIENERGSMSLETRPRMFENGYNSTTAIAHAGARPARDGRGRDDHGHENRETNTTRLTLILNDPALRLLFREFLRETLCEENLSFWLDVREFGLTFRALNDKTLDNIRETLAAAYGIYNAFLAPGSPCELNIDHTLRQDLASRMTRAVAKDEQSMYASLKEVAILFDRAQEQVFKLMAGDSVPKFTKTTRYLQIAGAHDIMSDDGSSNGHGSSSI